MSVMLAFVFMLTILVGVGIIWYWQNGGVEVDDEPETDPLAVTAAETDPFATTTEEGRVGRKSRIIALKESLERSLETREGFARGGTKDRMVMPWFMLVGAEGSGKKTILANNGLELPWGPPIEVDAQRKDAGKWWLYDEAVVLEAPAATPGPTEASSTLPPDQTIVDSSVGWSTLLHMLRRERPDSPLNGVIVTISCADLIAARSNPEKLEEQADRIHMFLERTRRFLGVRLPLHVLVTKCDALPGFKAFAESVPEAHRQDIFGWANPKDPELRFEAAWVDQGFMEMEERLSTLRDELLAAPEEVSDPAGVFIFASEFGDVQEPLKTFVARLMSIGERQPSLFFRGFYFTGDVVDPQEVAEARRRKSTKESRDRRSTSRVSAEIASEPHRLVFVKSLFANRIFREAGLARSTSRLRLSRDRRVVFAQAAALLIAFGGGFGLWTSVNGLHAADRAAGQAGLRADATLLTRVLSGVAIDLDELRKGSPPGQGSPLVRRSRDAAVIELVDQMRAVPSLDVRSAFIPTSWFSRLPRDVRASMVAGVRDIVLPVTRQRLIERTERVLGNAPQATHIPDELDLNDARSVAGYLKDVEALSRNLARYNSLASPTSGSLAELRGLLEYLFAERIMTDSTLANPEFEEALRNASAPIIPVSSDMAMGALRRAVSVINHVGSAAGTQLSPRRGTPDPADDLAALDALGALVELLDDQRGLVATVGDSTILGLRMARAVRDSIAAQLQLAAVRIAPDTLAPDSSARRLRNVVQQLYSFRLMQPVNDLFTGVESEIRAGERMRWDVGSLELALTLKGEYLQAVVATTVAFPDQGPERLQRALELQLVQRAIHAAASAQRFTPLADIEDPVTEIRLQGLNLSGAESRLRSVASMLDSLGASEEAARLLTSAVRQAEQAVAIAQEIFDRNTYLKPNAQAIAAWQGVLPFAFAAFGATDSLTFSSTLLRHETEIRALARYVAPALRFLRMAPAVDSVRAVELRNSWEDVLSSVMRYERGDITSSMSMLHRYIATDLMVSSLERCTALASEPDNGGGGTDIFIKRRREFRAALVARCIPGGSANAVAAYHRLRSHFQARLAGRYPFVDTTATAPVDAVASDVREFVRMLDEFSEAGEVAVRSDPRLAQTANAARQFLDRMAPARDFLAPFAAAVAPRALPEYGLQVSATGLVDSLPLMMVEVRSGSGVVGLEEAPQAITWRAPETISVVATPFDTTRAETILRTSGPWAALQFAQRPGLVKVALHHPDTRLPLPLPVFPTSAPEILILRPR